MPKSEALIEQLKSDVMDEIDHLESCREVSAAAVKEALLEIAEEARARADALDGTDTSIIEGEVSA